MKTALVVVDVQNYFINEHTADIAKKIKRFISEHGQDFDFILFTKFVNKEDSSHVKLLNWRKCFSSPDTDISPELSKFVDDNNVFVKSGYSEFKSEEFCNFLKTNNIEKLFLCGIDTDACILATAFDAFDLGYEVEVLEDLCGSHSGKDFHDYAMRIMKKSILKK